MNKKFNLPAPVGICSILVCVCALCVAVLCALSLSTATAHHRLQSKYADEILATAKAQVKADTLIAQIREGLSPEGVSLQNGGGFRFEVKINESLDLVTEGVVENGEVLITKRQRLRTAPWSADEGIQVAQPDA